MGGAAAGRKEAAVRTVEPDAPQFAVDDREQAGELRGGPRRDADDDLIAGSIVHADKGVQRRKTERSLKVSLLDWSDEPAPGRPDDDERATPRARAWIHREAHLIGRPIPVDVASEASGPRRLRINGDRRRVAASVRRDRRVRARLPAVLARGEGQRERA